VWGRNRKWPHFPPFFFLLLHLYKMSHCCLSFDLQLLIIPSVSSSFRCKGTFCTITIVRKKRRKMTSLPLTSLPVMTSLLVTSFPVTWHPGAHLSQIMMTYRSSKQSSTDQTPNMSPLQYSQSNDEESHYILKTNNPFLAWEPLCSNVFYVIQSLLLLSVSRKQDPHM
jgi:hypothetical protein